MTVLKYWDATQNQYVVIPGQPGQVYAQVGPTPPAVSAPVVTPPNGLLWVDTATNPVVWTPPLPYYPPQAPPASGNNFFTDQSGQIWASRNGSAWRRAQEVVHAGAWRNAGYTPTVGTRYVWDTVMFDPLNLFSGGAFTMPLTGYYLCMAQILENVVAPAWAAINMRVNASVFCQAYNHGSVSGTLMPRAHMIWAFSAGDVFDAAFDGIVGSGSFTGYGNFIQMQYLGAYP